MNNNPQPLSYYYAPILNTYNIIKSKKKIKNVTLSLLHVY